MASPRYKFSCWKVENRWNAFSGQSEASKLGKSARVLHSFSYKLRYEDFARQNTVGLNKLLFQRVCEDGRMTLLC